MTTAYMFTTNAFKEYKDIKLPKIETVKRIGKFKANKGVVIGDTDYVKIPLKNGIYDAYRINDNLMIIHKNFDTDVNIKHWKWKHFGGIGVDSGTFGFYDLETVENNGMPLLDEKNYKNFNDAKIIGNKEKVFGVMADTITGDGGFECYIINNDRAILIGGQTAYKLEL